MTTKGPTIHLKVAELRDRHDLAHLEVRRISGILWHRADSPEIAKWPGTWKLEVREVPCETCGGVA